MLKHLAACPLGAAVLIGVCSEALAEKRGALVIGNSAYEHTAPLKNPSNDATDIAAKLKELGFDVIDGTNLSKTAMEQRIRVFAYKLERRRCRALLLCRHGLR